MGLTNRKDAVETQLNDELDEYSRWACDAAVAAGSVLLEKMATVQVREKGKNDLVTDADLAAQALIKERLLGRFVNHTWVGEEDESFGEPNHDSLCWVVDPLDGTSNYAHGFPNFAVSIALVYRSQVHLGVIYDPCANELFTATRGGGAFLNGRSIRVSQQELLSRSLIAASFPPNVQRDSPAVEQFLNILLSCQSVRRLGAAALNLCYVACGRLDGYWTASVKPWDVAAGSLICSEAGATLRSFQGGPFDVWEASLIAGATESLYRQLGQQLRT